MNSFPSCSPLASPPPFIYSIFLANMNLAVTNSVNPIVSRILFSDTFETIPAPMIAPIAADNKISIKVPGSTLITLIKIRASLKT